MKQKEKLRVPDPNSIAVREWATFHGNVVDKCAVEALKIGYHELLTVFLYLRVAS